MIRNLLCAAVVLGLSLGLAMAEPVKAKITGISGNKINVTLAPKAKGEKGEAKTFDLDKDCKVMKGKEAVAGGLKAEELQNIDAKKGIGATLEVTDGKVTAITIGGKKK